MKNGPLTFQKAYHLDIFVPVFISYWIATDLLTNKWEFLIFKIVIFVIVHVALLRKNMTLIARMCS